MGGDGSQPPPPSPSPSRSLEERLWQLEDHVSELLRTRIDVLDQRTRQLEARTERLEAQIHEQVQKVPRRLLRRRTISPSATEPPGRSIPAAARPRIRTLPRWLLVSLLTLATTLSVVVFWDIVMGYFDISTNIWIASAVGVAALGFLLVGSARFYLMCVRPAAGWLLGHAYMLVPRGRLRTVLRLAMLVALLGVIQLAVVMPEVVFGPLLAGWDEIDQDIEQNVSYFMLYLPIGLLGLIRWGAWMSRKIPALLYRPIRTPYSATTTIVTPVYREDPVIFRKAIETWLENKPNEIIAVIDVTDTQCIAIANEFPTVTVVITNKPGKRAALIDGILAARSEIVILVDSDTIFDPGVIEKVIRPFADHRVGGVGTRQNVYTRDTVWQRIADIYLDLRYDDEVPALTRMGQAVSCLSGRTAAYRRSVLLPLMQEFEHETFLGKPCMSGDDKRLTTLVLKAGYNTYHQGNARVWSTFPPDLRTFIKQRIRWTRNSYRSDLRAMWEGWVWKRPYLAYILLDKAIAPYMLLIGLTFFVLSIVRGHWLVTGVLLGWWVLSRAIRIAPHLRRHPRDILLIPHFVLVNFMMTFIKAYALATVHQHKWLTRPVEVVDGQVMRTDAPVANKADSTAFATRAFGSLLLLSIIGLVQGLAWLLQGGRLP